MGSETSPLKLPVIDFSKVAKNSGSPEWNLVKSQVHKALEEYGFFEASYPKIPMECRNGILGAMEEVFSLPSETKMRNVSDKPRHGYIGSNPMVPLYESMGFEDANIAEKVESMTNVLWPEGNQNFSKTILSFSKQVAEFHQIITRMIVESLGLEKYLDEHIKSTYYLLRVMKYEGPQTVDTKLGLPSHTDKNLLTILYQNQVGGLEVQTKDGEWIDFVPSSNSFIVMVGDCLRAWTNGRLQSPYHRVMMTGNEPRYSAALFSFPKAGYMMKAPEELIDEGHPLLFKPFYFSDYFQFCSSGDGQRAASTLNAYCGLGLNLA